MPEDWYPADVTHVMIWPDGIAAQDLHANAPRLGRLSFYLRQQVQAYVSFEPLYQPGHVRTPPAAPRPAALAWRSA